MKTCPSCQQTLPASGFHKSKRRADGLSSWCKECKNERGRATYRAYYIKKHYNLTLEEHDQLSSDQTQQCAMCGTTTPQGRYGVFHTDHCHDTGILRGLLCHSCNTGLGLLGDNLAGIMEAAHYLSKSEPTLFPGIWKRIAPTTYSLNSKHSDLEMPKGCSSSRSSSETGIDAATAVTPRS